jgi:hypothetical protein
MSDPNMLLNFANQNQMQQPLTQLGGGIAQIQQMRQERMAQEQAQNAYRQALDAYMMDQNPQNLMALYQTSQPLGMFDNVTKAVEGMTTAQRQQDVDEMSRIYAPLVNGNTDLAVQNIDQYITAYENAGDLEGVQQLRSIREMVEQGRIQEATGQMGVLLGAYQEGRDFLDNVHSMGQERRAEAQESRAVFDQAQQYQLSQQEIDRYMDLATWAGDEPVMELMYYAKAFEEGAIPELDPADRADLVYKWNERFNQRLAEFRTYLGRADDIDSLYAQATDAAGPGGKETTGTITVYNQDGSTREVPVTAGVYDIGLMNSIQRMIDPATVREGDVNLMQASGGIRSQLTILMQKFTETGLLTPEMRNAILDMKNQLIEARIKDARIAADTVFGATDPLGLTHKEITGQEDYYGYLDSLANEKPPALTPVERARQQILQDYPEAEGMEGFADMTEEQLKANFPDVNFSQITATTLVPEREYALAVYPNELGDINRYNDTQFNETYMRTMDAMRAGIPANRALQWIEEQKEMGRWDDEGEDI